MRNADEGEGSRAAGFDLLIVGGCTIDLLIWVSNGGDDHLHAERIMVCCGGSCNLAIVAARLGMRVAVVDIIGDDDFGRHIKRVLAAEGVALRSPEGGCTTLVLILRGPKATRIHAFLGDGYRRLKAEHIDRNIMRGSRALFIPGVLFADFSLCRDEMLTVLRRACSMGLLTAMDVGPAVRRIPPDVLEEALRRLRLLFMNEEEARVMLHKLGLDDAIELRRRYGIDIVVIKMGPRGARALSAEGKVFVGAPDLGPPVDTLGAGDAFDAGFLYAILRGETIERALRLGCLLGALKVGRLGTGEMMPDREQIAEALRLIRAGCSTQSSRSRRGRP